MSTSVFWFSMLLFSLVRLGVRNARKDLLQFWLGLGQNARRDLDVIVVTDFRSLEEVNI